MRPKKRKRHGRKMPANIKAYLQSLKHAKQFPNLDSKQREALKSHLKRHHGV
jgi:hypothetical protein